jgi:hypothetical protein
MHDLPTCGDIDAHLDRRTTARADDLTLQPPGGPRLIENLQAIRGAVNVQVEALATAAALDVQEEPFRERGSLSGVATSEQAPKESQHDIL